MLDVFHRRPAGPDYRIHHQTIQEKEISRLPHLQKMVCEERHFLSGMRPHIQVILLPFRLL
jgi:hypothetical protein